MPLLYAVNLEFRFFDLPIIYVLFFKCISDVNK